MKYKKYKLKGISEINPTERLSSGTIAKYVPMRNITEFTKYISKIEQKKYKGGMKFRNGDILFARITPCLENGKTTLVDFLEKDEIAFGSTEYIVIREKEGISNKDYLYYLSTSPKFRERAIKLMTGTSGRQRVQINAFKNLEISLPPLPEQKRIANILSSFDNKIELLREQNKTLENIAQTIFKQWFIDFNFPDSNGKPYKDNGGKMVDSELGMIPEGWEVGKLRDIINLQGGFAFKSKNFKDIGDYGVIKIRNIQNNEIETKNLQYIKESLLKDISNKFVLSNGDILIAMTGAKIGKTGILNIPPHKKYVLNQRVGLFVPLYPGSDYYAYQFMKYKGREIIESLCSGSSAQPNISASNIENIKICIPQNQELESYTNFFYIIKTKIVNNLNKISMLENIKVSTLNHLL